MTRREPRPDRGAPRRGGRFAPRRARPIPDQAAAGGALLLHPAPERRVDLGEAERAAVADAGQEHPWFASALSPPDGFERLALRRVPQLGQEAPRPRRVEQVHGVNVGQRHRAPERPLQAVPLAGDSLGGLEAAAAPMRGAAERAWRLTGGRWRVAAHGDTRARAARPVLLQRLALAAGESGTGRGQPRSGGDLEQPGDEAGLSPHVSSADTPNLLLPDHRHRLVARQGSSRRQKPPKPRPDRTRRFTPRWSCSTTLFCGTWPGVAARSAGANRAPSSPRRRTARLGSCSRQCCAACPRRHRAPFPRAARARTRLRAGRHGAGTGSRGRLSSRHG